MLSPSQLDRLPRAVRDEIARLAANVAILERRLAEAMGEGSPETRISLKYLDRQYGLPDSAIVRFSLGPYPYQIDVSIETGRRRGTDHTLRICGLSSDYLTVMPEAANVVCISFERP